MRRAVPRIARVTCRTRTEITVSTVKARSSNLEARQPHPGPEATLMFDSFAQLFPPQWQPTILALTAPLRWLAEWQGSMLNLASAPGNPALRVLAWAALLLPALLAIAGMWCTAVSLYTLPF